MTLLGCVSCGEKTSTKPTENITQGTDAFETSKTETITDTAVVDDKKVDVIVISGQSNCEGNTSLERLYVNSEKEDALRYKSGYEKAHIKYVSGYNHKSQEFVNVKGGQGLNVFMFGIELGIAEAFYKSNYNRDIYIIKYSIGGTNLANQWRSKSSGGATGQLYTELIEFTLTSLDELVGEGLDPTIKAFCWMQGETDSMENYYSLYEQREADLFLDIQDDLKDYSSDDDPITFVDGGILDCKYLAKYKEINQAKQNVCNSMDNYFYLDTIGEGLTYDQEPASNPDLFHYDSLSELRLGEMFGECVLENAQLLK